MASTRAAAVALCWMLLACAKKGEVTQAGDLRVTLRIEPDPPVAGENKLHLSIADASGKAVDGARVSLAYDMPAMGAMPEMKGGGDVRALGGGRYDVDYPLSMSGDWSVAVAIEAPGHAPATVRFKVSPPREGYTLERPAPQAPPPAGDNPRATAAGEERAPAAGEGPRAAAAGEPQRGRMLEVSPARQQLIGVVYGKVERRPLTLSLRASGRVDVDETQVKDVVLKSDAWAEKLFVAQTGQRVRAGDPLLTVYSPDLLSSEEDLLVAVKSARAGIPGGDQLIRAAQERLRLWGLSPAQIAALLAQGKAQPRATIRSPIAGTVLEKSVVEGSRVSAGSVLYRIGNLGRLWVLADLFESDAPFVQAGQPATMTVPWAAGDAWRGAVSFVYPTVDEKTRAVRARLEFQNARLSLKPGMFVDVRIEVPLGTRLSIPDSALLASGEHRYAFVKRGEGRLLPVEVRTGARAGELDEVTGGLAEGDEVATQATFLLSSEAQLRDALPRWSTP